MYKVIWNSDHYTETYDNYEDFDLRVEEIAEETCYDIDVDGDTALIDDGDYEPLDEDYLDYLNEVEEEEYETYCDIMNQLEEECSNN